MKFPQPLRQFYSLYVNFFIVQVGRYLVDKASEAICDNEFRSRVFPRHRHPNKALHYPPLPSIITLNIPKIRIGAGTPFEFKYDEAIITRHRPHQGPGTLSESTYVWLMQAPGVLTVDEKNA